MQQKSYFRYFMQLFDCSYPYVLSSAKRLYKEHSNKLHKPIPFSSPISESISATLHHCADAYRLPDWQGASTPVLDRNRSGNRGCGGCRMAGRSHWKNIDYLEKIFDFSRFAEDNNYYLTVIEKKPFSRKLSIIGRKWIDNHYRIDIKWKTAKC